MNIEQILDQLLDASPVRREEILLGLKVADPACERRARKLLTYALDDAQISDSVDGAAPELITALIEQDERARIGERIGPFLITDLIRKGGMGVVFLAERADGAYEQKVAIKFIPKTILARDSQLLFEHERAHLARLEHPNIARIIDAGISNDQTPYYIMEYVDGNAIDVFASSLEPGERLKLFVQVCDAVAYCHRSLIVHGDIKPGNVLVADGRVRLLDFGIGRLLDEQEPAESSQHVRAFSPGYAAPEQLKGERPNVRTDIYALGALLHRILTGKNVVAGTAGHRSDMDHDAIMSADIRAIIDCCMSESPEKRYETVDALRTDIRAYRDQFPVSARKPTRRYRSQKFVRRNRLLVGATILIIVGLGLGLTTTFWQYRIARTEAERAQQVAAFTENLFARAGPFNSGEKDVTLLEIMDDAAERLPHELNDAPDVRNKVKQLIASGYYGIGEYDKSFAMRQEILDYWRGVRKAPYLEIIAALNELGESYSIRGDYSNAAALHREAIKQLDGLQMGNSDEAWDSWTRLGISESRANPTASLEAMRKAHEIVVALNPTDSGRLARSLANIAFSLRANGQFEEAVKTNLQALELAQDNNERLDTDIIATRCNLALDYSKLGRVDDAVATQKECIALKTERLGADHPSLVGEFNNLGAIDLSAGRLGDAEEIYDMALALAEEKLPETSLYRLAAEINYSVVLWQSGRARQIEPRLRSVLHRMESMFGANHSASGRARTILGRVVFELGNTIEAETLIENSLSGLTDSWRADALLWLAEVKLAQGDKAVAAQMARESLALRRVIPQANQWHVAESELILAIATEDAESQQIAQSALDGALPKEHIRRVRRHLKPVVE